MRPRSSREVGKVWAWACGWRDKDSLTVWVRRTSVAF